LDKKNGRDLNEKFSAGTSGAKRTLGGKRTILFGVAGEGEWEGKGGGGVGYSTMTPGLG